MECFIAAPGCYEATITQDGRTTTIVHRCASADCPGNK